ncbi:Arc family DNA-binding protein [Pseudomonas frederiksbergensis]|uniref:Arc family DNA-binding protein n=1 Tax=Pseudomonas frederiksbergensis TaxID=104087 RepID=UPI000F48142F|nr:Arc family DNA-binding protein [Pseudomonas frederiksbergensis]
MSRSKDLAEEWLCGSEDCGVNRKKIRAPQQEKSYIKPTLPETKLPHSQGCQELVVDKALDRFVLRLPDGLRLKLKRIAKENRRSLNGEIVARMERSLAQPQSGELSDEVRLALIREVFGLKDTLDISKTNADSD